MSKVQRYEDGGYNGYGVIEDDDGEYVLYSDYADLERQRDELVGALVDINNALPSEATDRQSIDVRRIVFKSLAKAEKDDD